MDLDEIDEEIHKLQQLNALREHTKNDDEAMSIADIDEEIDKLQRLVALRKEAAEGT